MAIDLRSEPLLSPSEIAALIPRRRAGKRCNVATVYRWMQTGVKGVQLEFLQCGGTRCSSAAAVQRFLDRLTAQVQSDAPPPPPLPRERERAMQAAKKRLAAAGL